MARHETSRNEDLRRLGDKIRGIRVAMLTTLDPDGVLRSRPMATQDTEFDGTLWFFTKRGSGKVQSIENDQHVNVAFANTDDQTYLSISGTARVVDDRDKMRDLWSPLMKAWFPDGVDDAEMTLIRIDAESAEIWDSPSSTVVQLAGLARALATGRSYDEGREPDRVIVDPH